MGGDGLCATHRDPERLREASRKGGEATRAAWHRKGLEEGELGDLESLEDARRWLRVTGEAVATGRLGHNDANAVTRTISEWVKAHSEETARGPVEDLEEEVARLKAQLRETGSLPRSLRKLRAVE